ncbi:MAG TPA: L-histidine N(alpha)-methyltransferase, partial [Candidatus Eisenbacteria bacterium]|nr:L-histidine N(alpha)-methyltransferase [Candidatus Eisenbacteria bacterium]
MSSVIQVFVHTSQFPERVRRDLLASLRTRQVNHKFHYDSYKQTQKWLALHEAWSPVRTDPNCEAIYDASFRAAAQAISSPLVTVIGLGCGGGQKDIRLLRLLARPGRNLVYLPCDVSAAMVLAAANAAKVVVEDCRPLVLDLALAGDLAETVADIAPREAARLATFFGMIPNFAPDTILPRLAQLIAPEDYLLFGANLAPGSDYDSGVQKILPQYDNELTREWLLTFLLDLGVERVDG